MIISILLDLTNHLLYVVIRNKYNLLIIYKLHTFVSLIINVTKMNDRLAMFLRAENMTAAKFAEILQVQPSSISHLLSGRNKPNFDFIARMLKMFADLNPDWLINGIGDMYRGDNGNNREDLAIGKQKKHEVTNGENELNFTSSNIENENVTNNTLVTTGNHSDQDPDSDISHIAIDRSIKSPNTPAPNPKPLNSPLNETLIDKVLVFYQDNTFIVYSKR